MNRLAQEHSPYLRQHQDNPVDWYPWGEEALARARQEDKPILLSVGYSACHWCHVMAHESFEDPDTARRMNDWYVNIKVDREERPDLDQLYQGVVQLMGRGGGWPLTVFLTPDLLPFFGGTYFPPTSRYGLPGFPVLLERLHETWTTQRPEVLQQAEQFRDGLQHVATYGLDAPASAVQATDIVDAAVALAREVDRKHGGFGGAPRFPNPMNVALLLRGYRRSHDEGLLSAVLLTLERMANGGIYDQLGGGFHRYSVDEKWLVPHFEKMLYDNAQLLHLYAEAQQLRPNPVWEKVARETVEYLKREMTSPEGGFYAAQDADSEGEEGKYFVWTPDEVQAVLTPEEAEVALEYFGITPEGNFEHGTTVLETRRTPGEVARALGRAETPVRALIEAACRKLFLHREKRVKPGRDDKILTGWNGLALRGLAFASRVFNEPEWALHAARTADFLLANMWDGKSLRRSWQEGAARIDGMLEDYGDLAAGLVALYQATFSPKYLEAADAIARRAVELFWDEGREAYFAAPKGQKDLVIATYAQHDNAFPSGASTLTEAQITLAALTGRTAHLQQAERYLSRMREPMRRNPFAFGHLLLAADAFADGAAEVTVVGARSSTRTFLDVLNRTYAPTYALLVHDPASPPAPIVSSVVSDRPLVDGGATAYVCRSFTCERPLTNPEALAERLSHP